MKPSKDIQKKYGDIKLSSALKTPNIYNLKNTDVDDMLHENFR